MNPRATGTDWSLTAMTILLGIGTAALILLTV